MLWVRLLAYVNGQSRTHYRVIEKLGGGGMGIVYRTEDSRLGGFVALKFLPQVAHSDPVAIERFRRGARAASAVIAGEITIRHRQVSYKTRRDGSLGEIKAEHEEFPMDPRCSPGWILSDHLEYQIPNPFGVGLLPTCVRTLEISLQYIQKPARCQRTTVSGVTTRRTCFQPDQTRRAMTQKSLSKSPRLGRGCRRFSTTSC
jgi:serine/threonine protein kinase